MILITIMSLLLMPQTLKNNILIYIPLEISGKMADLSK